MHRRCFIAALASGISDPGKSAPTNVRIRRIGFLSSGEALDRRSNDWLWSPLRKLGWVEGQNLTIERRYAGGRAELLQAMAEDLVRIRVELIVALGTVAAIAAKRATQTVPIVVHRAADPVAAGLVASLARPGGNVTGTSALGEIETKRIELIREILPNITRVGELTYSLNPIWQTLRKQKESAYRSFHMEPIFVDVTRADGLESAVAETVKAGAQVLVVATETLFRDNLKAILQAAQRLTIPVVGASASFVGTGALVGFGPSEAEYPRSLASIVDKVLGGANPADVPIQQPTEFELVIDLKAAKALGVVIPQSILIRADKVLGF